MSHLIVDRLSDAIVQFTLDRPPVNALDGATLDEMSARFAEIEDDLAVRAVILTGAGKTFCAGADVKALATSEGGGAEAFGGFHGLLQRIEQVRVPVIGALNGTCAGGGLELSLACDIRIGTPRTGFIAAGVTMGLMSGTVRLPRLIGAGNAALILMTGSKIDAEAALRYGLISEMVAPDELLTRARAIAERIATRAPLAVEANKRVLRSLAEDGEAAAIARLQDEVELLARSNDHKLAVESFGSATPPSFTRS